MKISSSYQEVRGLIIDWLCEVSETLHLSPRSMYNAVSILDKFLSNQLKLRKVEMEQNLVMLQGLSCLFIAAKNYEMDPTVPSSRKFLRQLPGYKPSQREQHRDQQMYQYGISAMTGQPMHAPDTFDSKKNELVE